MFRTVLFPFDQSRAAMDTAATVLQLVQQHDSKLVLLSVVEGQRRHGRCGCRGAAAAKSARHLRRSGHRMRTDRREGKPAFVIGDVADEIEADLIVMGTRGINLEQASSSTQRG